jgi:5-(carboxyamino)imidazole ribonucleotide mutase
MNQKKEFKVIVAMGSQSDWAVMEKAVEVLKEFEIPHEARILSAHRTPKEVIEFAENAAQQGVRVVIAGAGGAAHLPGMIAAVTELPVIGVPVAIEPMRGEDSLWSIVQMPKGIPVATVAIDNAHNAAILAIQILGAGGSVPDNDILNRLKIYKEELRKKVSVQKLS